MTGYAWIDGLEAYCFTVIYGVEPDEVIRRLGGDPAETELRTFEECFWRPDEPQWIQIGLIGGASPSGSPRPAAHHDPHRPAVVLAENNGWRVSEDETAMALSRGGWLASTFCDVSAVMRFVYAVDGGIRVAFDPLLDKRPEEGNDPRCLDKMLEGLPFDLDAVARSSMVLLERLTGVRIDPEWFERPQRAFPLAPLR